MDDGLSKFLNWLTPKKPCLLLAHNAKGFDAKHLMRAFTSCGKVDEFCQIAIGFSDTLPAFRELYPARKSYNQENLAKDLVDETCNGQSALDDSVVLQKLITALSDAVLIKHSFSNVWLQDYIVYLSQKSKALKSLQPLIHLHAISKALLTKFLPLV